MSDNRNATSSWSGYSHQGKLGIFVALQKINELLEQSTSIDNWKVIYENAEDFDIVESNNNVNSRHQVKAYNNAKYPNDVKDVLTIQEYSMVDGLPKLTQKGFQIRKFDQVNGNPLAIEVDENSRFLHVISEIKGFYLSENDFNTQYSGAAYVSNPNNVKLFKYPNSEQYCSLSTSELKEFCKIEIMHICQRCNHTEKDNSAYHSGMFDGLMELLDNEIRQKHILGSYHYPELSFQKIHEYIISSNNFTESDIFRLRRSFSDSYLEYKIELDVSGIDFSENEANVETLIKEIYELDDNKFLNFLQNIHIEDEKFTKNTNININGLKEVFFHCLINYKNFDKLQISFTCKKKFTYVLTTINSDDKLLPRRIVLNSNITKNIFEKNYIINKYLSLSLIDSILEIKDYTKYKNELDTNNWKNFEDVTTRLVSDNDLFLNPKDIKLISISDLYSKDLEKAKDE